MSWIDDTKTPYFIDDNGLKIEVPGQIEYVYLSNEPFNENKVESIRNLGAKAFGGLWGSEKTNGFGSKWAEFTFDTWNGHGLTDKGAFAKYATTFKINEASKILYINSEQDYKNVVSIYGRTDNMSLSNLGLPFLDYEKIAKDFNGVHVTPQMSGMISNGDGPLGTFDVDSIHIFDVNAIDIQDNGKNPFHTTIEKIDTVSNLITIEHYAGDGILRRVETTTQDGTVIESKQYNIEGNPEYFIYEKDGNYTEETYHYFRDGTYARGIESHTDYSFIQTKEDYNEKGELIRSNSYKDLIDGPNTISSYYQDGKLSLQYIYRDGDKVEERHYDGDGQICMIEKFREDKTGRQYTDFYDANGKLERTESTHKDFYGKRVDYPPNENGVQVTEWYDDDGKIEYKDENSKSELHTIEYDKSGHIVSEYHFPVVSWDQFEDKNSRIEKQSSFVETENKHPNDAITASEFEKNETIPSPADDSRIDVRDDSMLEKIYDAIGYEIDVEGYDCGSIDSIEVSMDDAISECCSGFGVEEIEQRDIDVGMDEKETFEYESSSNDTDISE